MSTFNVKMARKLYMLVVEKKREFGKKARISLEFLKMVTFPVSYKESEDTDRFVLTSNT